MSDIKELIITLTPLLPCTVLYLENNVFSNLHLLKKSSSNPGFFNARSLVLGWGWLTSGSPAPISSRGRLILHTIYLRNFDPKARWSQWQTKEPKQQYPLIIWIFDCQKCSCSMWEEGKLLMLFKRYPQDMMDVWLDQNLLDGAF